MEKKSMSILLVENNHKISSKDRSANSKKPKQQTQRNHLSILFSVEKEEFYIPWIFGNECIILFEYPAQLVVFDSTATVVRGPQSVSKVYVCAKC